MRITCPNCKKVMAIADPPVQMESQDEGLNRNILIMAIVVATGLAGAVGFLCGGILTRVNRQDVKAELSEMQAKVDRAIANEKTTKKSELLTNKFLADTQASNKRLAEENRRFRQELKQARIDQVRVQAGLSLEQDENVSTGGGSEDGLEILSWKWVNENALNTIKIEGVVGNKTKRSYKSVQIYITATNERGDFLGIGNSYLRPDPILPGGNCTFTVYIDDAICDSATLRISYRFGSIY